MYKTDSRKTSDLRNEKNFIFFMVFKSKYSLFCILKKQFTLVANMIRP